MVTYREEPSEQDFRDAGLGGDIGAPPAITPLDLTAGSPGAALAAQIQDMDAYIDWLQSRLLEASTDLDEQIQLQTAINGASQRRGQLFTAYNNAVRQEGQIAKDTVWAEQQTLDRDLTAQQNRISNDLERGRLSFQQAQEQFVQQLGLAREKLAQQEALARYADWAMPEGLEFHPGYEPGGAASTAMGLLGAKFTPVPVRRIDFNPVGELPSPTVTGASQYTPGTQLPSPGTGAGLGAYAKWLVERFNKGAASLPTGAGLGAAIGASTGLRAAIWPSVLSNRSPYGPPYTPPPAGTLGGTARPPLPPTAAVPYAPRGPRAWAGPLPAQDVRVQPPSSVGFYGPQAPQPTSTYGGTSTYGAPPPAAPPPAAVTVGGAAGRQWAWINGRWELV